jgi:hypothetical protein
MPRTEPNTPEWDDKLNRLERKYATSYSRQHPCDVNKNAAAALAYMQCDRDFWKEMYMELSRETGRNK